MKWLHDYWEIGCDARMEIVKLTKEKPLKATLSFAQHSPPPILRVSKRLHLPKTTNLQLFNDKCLHTVTNLYKCVQY